MVGVIYVEVGVLGVFEKFFRVVGICEWVIGIVVYFSDF